MFTEIINCLQLSSFSGNKFIVVTKDVVSDINFVFCELLSHYFSKKYTVILLNFAQSYAHYNHVLMKYGINLRQLRENQQFLTIDGLSETEKLANLTASDKNENVGFKDLFIESGSTNNMQSLYFLISETIKNLLMETKQFVFIIDDISSLFNLGLDARRIVPFVQYCHSLCCSDLNSQNILLLGSVYEKEDLVNKNLTDYLHHLADVRIQVEALKTGFSKDVHGKIALTVRNSEDGTLDHQKMLFKVTEEGAKLFTYGI